MKSIRRLLPAATVALALVTGSSFAEESAAQQALTLEKARELAATTAAYAKAHAMPPVAIAVVDAGATLVYLERVDGAFMNSSDISIGKARTAMLFGRPTRLLEDAVNKGRYAMLAMPAVAPFTPVKGGVPIVIDGRIVGAIGVSGADGNQDDEIATAGAAKFVATHDTNGAPAK
jgi:glc operon protein GlcG